MLAVSCSAIFVGLIDVTAVNIALPSMARGMHAPLAGLQRTVAAYTLVLASLMMAAGDAADRLGRWVLIMSGAALTLSCAVLSRLVAGSSAAFLVVTFALFGLGYGVVNPPVIVVAVSGMPESHAGVAAGINASSRQLGQVLGIAVVGALYAASLHAPPRAGFPVASLPGGG